MPDIVIDVRDLQRTYHVGDVDIQALRGVSFTVARGEFVAIIGASGSGKSTLMAILGCLDRPTAGEYFFEGVDISRATEPELARIRSERLGFVFQSFNLLARTTAIENVALPLFYRPEGPPPRLERTARARGLLQAVGLGARQENTPAQLSGGQQQRVAIARALVNAPSVLFADEPTGNLDIRTSHEIMNMLVALNRDEGVTIVLVTHEPDIAAYADRVLTMRDGELVSDERKSMSVEQPPTEAAETHGAVARLKARASSARRDPLAFVQMIAAAAVQAIARNKMRAALNEQVRAEALDLLSHRRVGALGRRRPSRSAPPRR